MDEGRKRILSITASILAARKLAQSDGESGYQQPFPRFRMLCDGRKKSSGKSTNAGPANLRSDQEEVLVKNKQKQDFESVVGKLNAAYFFREFTFSTNTFKPNPASELELADKVVWLDDLMILSQIKERIAPPNTTADKERKWFTDQVVKKATRQMRDTLSYLKTYPKIKVQNNRRHVFNIAGAQVTQTHRIVIYNPHPLLPPDCATKKYHRSRTAGVRLSI